MALTVVRDLRNPKIEVYFDLPPKEAVRNAYALLGQGDGETWNYAKKYDHLVEESVFSFFCGDYVAWKEGHLPTKEEVHKWLVSTGHPDAVENERLAR